MELEVFIRHSLWVRDSDGRTYMAGPRLIKGDVNGRTPPRLEFCKDSAEAAEEERKALESYLRGWQQQNPSKKKNPKK